MTVKSYKDLVAWQKAMALAELVYGLTTTFPKEEVYGLTSQVRRAVVSIASNVAEGQPRDTTRDFLKFLAIARGSLAELETQLLLSQRLKFGSAEKIAIALELAAEVGRLLQGLSTALKAKLRD